MAQCRLPFSFNILPKLSPRQRPPLSPEGGRRKRPRPEQKDGDPVWLPEFRRRKDDPNARAPGITPGNGQIHHPGLVIDNQSAPQGREDISSSSLSLVSLPQPAGSAHPSSVQVHAISLPKTDGERTPFLIEVNPDSGSTTGGVRIWLKGMDFPALLPLFARFGAAVVPTVRT